MDEQNLFDPGVCDRNNTHTLVNILEKPCETKRDISQIPIIDVRRNCRGYIANWRKISEQEAEIEKTGIDVRIEAELIIDGELTKYSETVRTYCPRAIFPTEDGKYQACRYMCLSQGARTEMCSNGNHKICPTYDKNNPKLTNVSGLIPGQMNRIFGGRICN